MLFPRVNKLVFRLGELCQAMTSCHRPLKAELEFGPDDPERTKETELRLLKFLTSCFPRRSVNPLVISESSRVD